jgi:ubiquinone/menaquinone biosynthesis C-methylase UbiE
MATVFMKWLETNPKDYDRGIQLLTLGRIQRIKEKIANNYVRTGMRVLEIGCGTGTLTLMMAKRGAIVTGIDASPWMLAEAEKKVKDASLEEHVSLKYMDAALIGDRFPAASFDLIVSTLVFSELPSDDQRFVLEACQNLLTPDGRLVIADEVIPAKSITRFLFYLVRMPLVLLTWLITRTTTHSLRGFDALLKQIGFQADQSISYLGNSLALYEARLPEAEQVQQMTEQKDGIATCCVPRAIQSMVGEKEKQIELPSRVIGRLQHRVTIRTLLLDLLLLFLRIPYKFRTGLYAVGYPDSHSPVLVTGNFDLTVRRLVKAIDGKVNAWLLVSDSAGINVWCAAGGGYFTAEKVIAAVKSSHLNEVVSHHALILPQLCANGVDGWRIRKETGWGVHWGTIRADDIPAYLAGRRKKSDEMRWIKFPLKDRLEMVTVTLGFYSLLLLLPVFILWRSRFWPITFSLLGISYFYAIVLPWLPGRDGLYKSIPLTIISLAGLFVYTSFWNPMPIQQLFHWLVGLTGLSVFTSAEFQGMSPLMRGEQANWSREAIIGLTLGVI